MPFIFNLNDTLSKEMYLQDVYNSIVFQDVLKRANVNKIDLLDKLIRFVMMNIGHPFSANSLSKYLKKNAKRHSKSETIYNYLKYFENACFIHRVFRENIMGKGILKTNEKFYLTDQGFRQAVYGNNKRDINLILENIVYMELIRRGYTVTVGEINKKEIDFIAKKGDKKIYFQVSYIIAEKSTKTREFAPFLKIKDSYPKYVLSTDSIEYNYEGIKKKTITNFLLGDWWEN